MRYTFISDEPAWERYTAGLDRLQTHEHRGGPPEKYPCAAVSTYGSSPNGDFYDHEFLYKEDAKEFCRLFELHQRKPLRSKWKPWPKRDKPAGR